MQPIKNTSLNVRQMAQMLGVSPNTVRHWVQIGYAPKPGRLGTGVRARMLWPIETAEKFRNQVMTGELAA